MILEHSNAAPHSVQLLQVNPTYGADLAQWTVIFVPVTQHCEVTSCTARRMQEAVFCHDGFKNLAKMEQLCWGAVGLCQIVMILQ
jgi:hypothetical protein